MCKLTKLVAICWNYHTDSADGTTNSFWAEIVISKRISTDWIPAA